MASQTCMFLPSEVARLVLGFLKESECNESYIKFLHESPYLADYLHEMKLGIEHSTLVQGWSLLTILRVFTMHVHENHKKPPWRKSGTISYKLIKKVRDLDKKKETLDLNKEFGADTSDLLRKDKCKRKDLFSECDGLDIINSSPCKKNNEISSELSSYTSNLRGTNVAYKTTSMSIASTTVTTASTKSQLITSSSDHSLPMLVSSQLFSTPKKSNGCTVDPSFRSPRRKCTLPRKLGGSKIHETSTKHDESIGDDEKQYKDKDVVNMGMVIENLLNDVKSWDLIKDLATSANNKRHSSSNLDDTLNEIPENKNEDVCVNYNDNIELQSLECDTSIVPVDVTIDPHFVAFFNDEPKMQAKRLSLEIARNVVDEIEGKASFQSWVHESARLGRLDDSYDVTNSTFEEDMHNSGKGNLTEKPIILEKAVPKEHENKKSTKSSNELVKNKKMSNQKTEVCSNVNNCGSNERNSNKSPQTKAVRGTRRIRPIRVDDQLTQWPHSENSNEPQGVDNSSNDQLTQWAFSDSSNDLKRLGNPAENHLVPSLHTNNSNTIQTIEKCSTKELEKTDRFENLNSQSKNKIFECESSVTSKKSAPKRTRKNNKNSNDEENKLGQRNKLKNENSESEISSCSKKKRPPKKSVLASNGVRCIHPTTKSESSNIASKPPVKSSSPNKVDWNTPLILTDIGTDEKVSCPITEVNFDDRPLITTSKSTSCTKIDNSIQDSFELNNENEYSNEKTNEIEQAVSSIQIDNENDKHFSNFGNTSEETNDNLPNKDISYSFPSDSFSALSLTGVSQMSNITMSEDTSDISKRNEFAESLINFATYSFEFKAPFQKLNSLSSDSEIDNNISDSSILLTCEKANKSGNVNEETSSIKFKVPNQKLSSVSTKQILDSVIPEKSNPSYSVQKDTSNFLCSKSRNVIDSSKDSNLNESLNSNIAENILKESCTLNSDEIHNENDVFNSMKSSSSMKVDRVDENICKNDSTISSTKLHSNIFDIFTADPVNHSKLSVNELPQDFVDHKSMNNLKTSFHAIDSICAEKKVLDCIPNSSHSTNEDLLDYISDNTNHKKSKKKVDLVPFKSPVDSNVPDATNKSKNVNLEKSDMKNDPHNLDTHLKKSSRTTQKTKSTCQFCHSVMKIAEFEQCDNICSNCKEKDISKIKCKAQTKKLAELPDSLKRSSKKTTSISNYKGKDVSKIKSITQTNRLDEVPLLLESNYIEKNFHKSKSKSQIKKLADSPLSPACPSKKPVTNSNGTKSEISKIKSKSQNKRFAECPLSPDRPSKKPTIEIDDIDEQAMLAMGLPTSFGSKVKLKRPFAVRVPSVSSSDDIESLTSDSDEDAECDNSDPDERTTVLQDVQGNSSDSEESNVLLPDVEGHSSDVDKSNSFLPDLDSNSSEPDESNRFLPDLDENLREQCGRNARELNEIDPSETNANELEVNNNSSGLGKRNSVELGGDDENFNKSNKCNADELLEKLFSNKGDLEKLLSKIHG